jgi:hypothetical protein
MSRRVLRDPTPGDGGGAPPPTVTLRLANTYGLKRGDRLRLESGEEFHLLDHPNTADNTVTVRREVTPLEGIHAPPSPA